MKHITVRDKEGGYKALDFYLNDDMEVTVEHEDGKVDVVIPEKVSADINAQTERLEKLFGGE